MREIIDAIRTMVRRAAITAVDDGGSQQLVDLSGMASDAPAGVVRVQEFGFASNPPAGGEGLIICPGGRSQKAMFLGGAGPGRPTDTPPGCALLYDSKGNVVFCKAANGIQIASKQGKITVTPAPGQILFLGGDGVTGVYVNILCAGNIPAMNVRARTA